MCAVCKNNNYKLHDFMKNLLFISYKEYPYDTILSITFF